MIVVDASVVVDMLLGKGSEAGDSLAARISSYEAVCTPHLIDAEVGQVLRRFTLQRSIDPKLSAAMVQEMVALPLLRYPHTPLLERAFALCANVTVYDAIYLALAEALDCPLLTGDAALRAVPGCSARVEVVSTSAT